LLFTTHECIGNEGLAQDFGRKQQHKLDKQHLTSQRGTRTELALQAVSLRPGAKEAVSMLGTFSLVYMDSGVVHAQVD